MLKYKNIQTTTFARLTLAVATLILAACTGAPAPVTTPDESANATSENTNVSDNSPKNASTNTDEQHSSHKLSPTNENTEIFNSQALDNYRLSTPKNIPTTDNDVASHNTGSKIQEQANGDTASVDTTAKIATNAYTDPYTAFPSLAEGVFAYADALYKAGFADSAVAYLERFRIIKPLWAQWEAKTDSMLHEYKKIEAEKAKQFEPMVLEIQNMNRAHAAYSMVAETADSLIAQNPGDSLTNWATAQKQLAYTNTLSKAQKEYAQIKSLAEDQAKFDEAKKKASEFQMRYRDFEDTLHIQTLIDYIAELAAQNDPAAAKYWEKNDPAKALAQADALIAADKFKEARELLNKLKASKLRKEANDRLQMLGDAYCNKQRKETSQIFAKAQKQKDEAKKRELLKQAIAPLDKCLSEYPNNSQRKKVQENKEFLEKELAK